MRKNPVKKGKIVTQIEIYACSLDRFLKIRSVPSS